MPEIRFGRSALHQKHHSRAVAPRNLRSVWIAVTSAPLSVRTKITRLSKFFAHSTVPLKPAHSKRFATKIPSVRIVATRWHARTDAPHPCANSQEEWVLPRFFKRHPPEPVAARGEPDQRVLERWRQHEPLQPFCPGQPPGKRGIATAGDLRPGLDAVDNKIRRSVKKYLDLSAKQTTDVTKRQDREKLFREILGLL
jgi:hypothetical protein